MADPRVGGVILDAVPPFSITQALGRRSMAPIGKQRKEVGTTSEVIVWLNPHDFDAALQRNNQYRHDCKLVDSTPLFEEDPTVRHERNEAIQRMKTAGVWPRRSRQSMLPVRAIPYERTLGEHARAPANIRFLRDKRFVMLEIDITTEKETLLQAMWEEVVFFRGHRRAKPKKKQFDCWEIWDQVHHPIHPKTRYQIAQEKCGSKANPTEDDDAKSKYAQVCRAYKKAEQLIRRVYHLI